MRKKVLLIFLSCLLFSGITRAQHFVTLRAKVTYNSFAADGLKEIQNQVAGELRDMDIPVSAVESFPPYFGMQFQVLIPVKDSSKLSFGVYYEQFSTGGRLHYKDYSGEVGFDQTLKANVAGLILEKNLDTKSDLALSLNLGLSLIWAKLDMKTFERIYDQKNEAPMSFSNFTLGLLPGFVLSYNLYDTILSGSVSYQLCLPSSFYYNGEVVKKQKDGEPFTPGMNGIRLGFGLGYSF